MVRAVYKADAMLTLSALYIIGSHLPFICVDNQADIQQASNHNLTDIRMKDE